MLCDKCNKTVDKRDDATILMSIINNNPFEILLYNPRHILCSFSRAQYIVHPDFKPVIDNRPEYDKRLIPDAERVNREIEFTNAWIKLQAM